MTLQETFDNFILSRRLADLSPKTIEDYVQFLRPFLDALGPCRPFSGIMQEDIDTYIATLLNKPISKATRATYIRHLKIFLRWAENKYCAQYASSDIKVPKSPKKSVLIYTADHVQMIFEAVSAESPWLVYRNQCIIALMYDSGVRQSEVCTLLRDKIVLSENRMTVHGKGDKERTVPMGTLTKTLMQQYLTLCPHKSDFLFVNRRGERLTCNAVKLFMTKIADKLPFELSSHKLRHNFATNYCIDQYEENGHVDIFRLMYLMGHEDVETTQRYLHFAMEIVAAKGCISHLDKVIGE